MGFGQDKCQEWEYKNQVAKTWDAQTYYIAQYCQVVVVEPMMMMNDDDDDEYKDEEEGDEE